jgi:hypothetical protein
MPPLTVETFERRLRDLPRDRAAAFLASLLRVDRESITVVGRRARSLPDRADGSPGVVCVRGAPTARLEAAAAERGAACLSAADLHERLLYDYPPDDADDLCEAYFGQPARRAASGDPDYSRVDPPGSSRDPADDRPSESRTAATDGAARTVGVSSRPVLAAVGGALVGAVAVALVVATVGGGLGVVSPASGGGPGGDAAAAPTTSAASEGDGTGDDASTGAPPTPTAGIEGPILGAGLPETPAEAGNVTEPRYLGLRPTCDRPPSLVVAVQVGALRNNGPDDGGIRTTYAFASPQNKQFTGPFDNFRTLVKAPSYAALVNHTRAEFGPLEREGDEATQRVVVRDENGTPATFEFGLSEQEGGQFDGCWMTDTVASIGNVPTTDEEDDASPAAATRSAGP